MPNSTCSIDECARRVRARQLCAMHYLRAYRSGAELPSKVRVEKAGECIQEGCASPRKARGMCVLHYTRWYRKGDPGDNTRQRVTRYAGRLCNEDGCERPARYLSMCRRHYRYYRLKSVPHEWRHSFRWCMTVWELAERDGNGCALCGDPIDMKATLPDVMAPSVDHVTPRSLGGLDEPRNVALAHLICNMRKGNRPLLKKEMA